MRVEYSKDAFNLDLSGAEFAGGPLKGSVAGSLREGEADLSLRAALQSGAVQEFAWRRAETPVASGLLDLSFEARARGRSMAGLISSLTGSGSLALRDGRLNGINSAALAAVARLQRASTIRRTTTGARSSRRGSIPAVWNSVQPLRQ
jgi:uncharacterized protein involved in outer membrane biogenesis